MRDEPIAPACMSCPRLTGCDTCFPGPCIAYEDRLKAQLAEIQHRAQQEAAPIIEALTKLRNLRPAPAIMIDALAAGIGITGPSGERISPEQFFAQPQQEQAR